MTRRGYHPIVAGGGAQTISHVPPVRVDASPAPTVHVFDATRSEDSAERDLVASGPATVDGLEATIVDTSGRGQADPRRIEVPGGAPSVDVEYVVENAGGGSEIVTLDEVHSDHVIASSPLVATYVAGNYLRGLRLSVEIPALVADDEDLLESEHPIGVRWTYTIAGRLVVVTEQARVVRDPGGEAYVGAAAAILAEEWDELVQQLPRRANSLRNLVRGVARRLSALLRARHIAPGTFLAGEIGLEVLVQRCVWRFGELGHVPRDGSDPTTWVERQRTSYLNLWHSVVRGKPGHGVAELDPVTDTAPPGHSRKRRGLIALK